nr:protein hol1 [Quercus suber]
MGLGVLEDKQMRRVPGTATLEDEKTFAHISDNLKRTADGIIFVPQPSDDPNDPMITDRYRFAAANPVSITDIALLTGYHLLGVGLSGFVYVAAARVWGKRPMYLAGAVIMIISSAWCGRSGHNYNSFVAARFFQGVGLAPFEALVNSSVTDMYAVHERGKRMAFSNMCLFGGAFFTPVIVGVITHSLGWQWPFYFVAIFLGALLPFVYLFCPETAFDREASVANSPRAYVVAEETSSSVQMSLHGPTSAEVRNQKGMASSTDQTSMESPARRPSSESAVGASSGHPPPARVTFLSKEKLRVFGGRQSKESFIKLLLRPFALFLHPVFVFACLIQGSLIAFTVMIGVVLALVFLQPPLSFNEVEDGYMYTGALIGSLVGFLAAGAIGDSSTKFLTKRNGGIFEPEFRLVLVIPYAYSIPRRNSPLTKHLVNLSWVAPVSTALASQLTTQRATAGSGQNSSSPSWWQVSSLARAGWNQTHLDHRRIGADCSLSVSCADVYVPPSSRIPYLFVSPRFADAISGIFGKKARAFSSRHDLLALLRLR